MAFYYYGLRAVIVTLVAVVSAVLTDYICCAIMKRKFDWYDPSPAMSAILLALLMPASVPYPIMAFSCVFMVAVAKYAFGGNRNLIFSPVAVTYAFSSITWSQYIMRYPIPEPFGNVPLDNIVTDNLVHSFTYMLDNSAAGTFSLLDIVWGKLAGPMGTSAVLIILISGVALYLFGDIEPTVFFTGIAANVLLNVLFPGNIIGWEAFLYSLVTGSYMFTLVFMAGDRRFVPKHELAQFLYALTVAVAAFLFRRFTIIENGAVFGLMFAGLMRDEFDRWSLSIHNLGLKLNAKIIDKHNASKSARDARRNSIDAAKAEMSSPESSEKEEKANG